MKKSITLIIFFLMIFASSCKKDPVEFQLGCTRKEKRAIEAFLKELMLEEGGVYTLFGSKPITSMIIFNGTLEDVSTEGLSKDSLQSLQYHEDNTSYNFAIWKKFKNKLQLTQYVFLDLKCPIDSVQSFLIFINVDQTIRMIKHNWKLFKDEKLIPFEKIEELRKAADLLKLDWVKILENDCLAGLLYGYGEKNTRAFLENRIDRIISDDFEGKVTTQDFPIPIFVITENDQMSIIYKKQREEIKKILATENHNSFTSLILEYLQKSSSHPM